MVCLVLAALSVDAGGYVQSGLYNNYQGDYAAAYDNYEPRSYAFEYGVSDPHTGDHKSQWETKGKDGVVRGSYSLLESDGSTRIVDYVADDHGFRAVVKKIGVHGHPESIESHGGGVEEAGGFPPIVVAEPESIPLEQPLHVEQNTLHLEQPIHVQQPIHYQPPVHVPEAPIFHSYDGGIEDYQNLYNQQPYHFQVPKAEGIYVDAPKYGFGYEEQPYAAPKPIYLEQPYPQQPHVAPDQSVYLQQPYQAHGEEGYGHQSQFLPNPEFYAPKEHPHQGLLPPRAEGYYTQHNQYAQPKGDGDLAYHQPQQYVPQEQVHAVEQSHQVPIQGKLDETYQNHQQYPASKENTIEPYQIKLPVEGYHLEQSFPGENQVLLDNPGQYGGHERVLHPYGESSQGYYGSTGNLHDDSEYTNYGNSALGEIPLNQGEYLPQASHYKNPLPLPLKYVQGHQIIHK